MTKYTMDVFGKFSITTELSKKFYRYDPEDRLLLKTVLDSLKLLLLERLQSINIPLVFGDLLYNSGNFQCSELYTQVIHYLRPLCERFPEEIITASKVEMIAGNQ